MARKKGKKGGGGGGGDDQGASSQQQQQQQAQKPSAPQEKPQEKPPQQGKKDHGGGGDPGASGSQEPQQRSGPPPQTQQARGKKSQEKPPGGDGDGQRPQEQRGPRQHPPQQKRGGPPQAAPPVQQQPSGIGGPPQERGGPPQDRGGPSEGRGGPPQDRGDTSQGRGGPPQDRGDPSQGRGGPPQGRGSPSRGRGGPPRGKGGPPQGRGGGRGGTPEPGGVPPEMARGPPPGMGDTQGRGGPLPTRGDPRQPWGGIQQERADTPERGEVPPGMTAGSPPGMDGSQGRGGPSQGRGGRRKGPGGPQQGRAGTPETRGVSKEMPPGPTPQQQSGRAPQQPRSSAPQGPQPPTEQFEQLKLVKVQPGTQGRRILVESNHLRLNLGNLREAVHYDVNIVPDTPKRFLRTVMEIFRRENYPKRFPAFDGRKNLYSTNLLPFGDSITDEVKITDDDGREKKYKVEIKFANRVDLTPLQNMMSSEMSPMEALQCVDIVLRNAPASNCLPVGRSFFTKPHGRIIDLGEGMEMYNGFYQSAVRGWKPLLNVDVAHKAFPKNVKVVDAIVEVLSDYRTDFRNSLQQPMQGYQREKVEKFLKTLRVVYEIPGQSASRRVHRVNGLGDCPKNVKFQAKEGFMTVENYFKDVKRYKLSYPLLPTLWVGNRERKDKILLPMELCVIQENQAVNRKMTENQTSSMIKYAATSTDVRKGKIMDQLGKANHNADPCMREFGFSIGNQFERLNARVLTPPALEYANKQRIQPSRGVWRADRNRFLDGARIDSWTIVNADRFPQRQLDQLASMLFGQARQCGMNITQEAQKPFENISGRQAFDDIRQHFSSKLRNFNLIIVVVPNSGPQYSYVKRAAEINVGCLTQCIKSKTLNKLNAQTVGNILLKINSKLNGTNHCLLTRPPIMNQPCMIMGADVTHPGPDSQGIPSVAAVTASHDPKAFKYNICWRLQPPRTEIIEDLTAITREHLLFFYKMTKCKPQKIVFFRDGVSEGQFEQVRYEEITAIRKACSSLGDGQYQPKVTFLVVQKRHHTRLFPTNPQDSEDRNNNVPAGTCVDTDITHPFLQDFYLVSHASIQGVAKPTKYCTLHDENDMSNDEVEQLAYFLCHMFTRCNRSVSYPAPTYYAHLAAARTKVYTENNTLDMDNLAREQQRFQIMDEIRKGKPMFFV